MLKDIEKMSLEELIAYKEELIKRLGVLGTAPIMREIVEVNDRILKLTDKKLTY